MVIARHMPLPQVLKALDSPTTARVLDRVDIGAFQPEKVFSRTNAGVLSALATLSYSTPADQSTHLIKQKSVRGFHILDSANNKRLGIDTPDRGANVTVVETADALLVAARGTAPPWLNNVGQENEWSWKDLAADLNAVPVPNYAGSADVHAGFKLQADSIWEQLQPLLKTALATHKAIHITGHSLGAAVALQLADRMHHEMGTLPQSVLRLAGPEIGWKAEKKHLERTGLAARTVNVENSGDPIPNILPGGYNAGTEIYFNRHGHAEVGGGNHWLDSLLGQADAARTGHALVPLYPHFPQLYVHGLLDPKNAPVLDAVEKKLNA